MKKKKKMLVVGDIILDRFVYGEVNRISPEAPVPILDYEYDHYSLGGAANVAKNLVRSGCYVYLVGRVGNDKKGRKLIQFIKDEEINADGVSATDSMETIIKTRYIANSQTLLRMDNEEVRPMHSNGIAKLKRSIWNVLSKVDGIILSDYAKGVVIPEIIDAVTLSTIKEYQKVFVDPKGKDAYKYTLVDFMTPNVAELELMEINTNLKHETIARRAEATRQRLGMKAVLVTKGRHGMTLVQEGCRPLNILAEKRNQLDVTGAGDVVIATFACAIIHGAMYDTAAKMANKAAGEAIERRGTSCV
jgi:D-beta-D-heptose 7-phosphate kinase/D-beta-D-heptose 1-phosphate adenosyltransferase